MPLLQKLTNKITFDATKHCLDNFKVIDRLLMKRRTEDPFSCLRRHCRVSIITCGGRDSIGFSCTQHKDNGDLVEGKNEKKDIENQDCGRDARYKNRINGQLDIHKDLFGIGVPTTCGYKLVQDKKKSWKNLCVMAYFILGGFEACVSLDDNTYHIFLGYAFSHSTALPIGIMDGIVYYHIKGVNLFAWGASGS